MRNTNTKQVIATGIDDYVAERFGPSDNELFDQKLNQSMITARRIDYRSVEMSNGTVTILCKGETFHRSHCTPENLIEYFDYFVELAESGHEAIAII